MFLYSRLRKHGWLLHILRILIADVYGCAAVVCSIQMASKLLRSTTTRNNNNNEIPDDEHIIKKQQKSIDAKRIYIYICESSLFLTCSVSSTSGMFTLCFYLMCASLYASFAEFSVPVDQLYHYHIHMSGAATFVYHFFFLVYSQCDLSQFRLNGSVYSCTE